jgi:hypothetical protein
VFIAFQVAALSFLRHNFRHRVEENFYLIPDSLSLFDTMLNFVENLLENETDPRSGPMNCQDHSLSLSDPDRSLVLSHFLTNFLQNLASCHTAFILSILLYLLCEMCQKIMANPHAFRK